MTSKEELEEAYRELVELEAQWETNNKTKKGSKYSVSHKLLGYLLVSSTSKSKKDLKK